MEKKQAYVTCKSCGHRFLVTPADFRAVRGTISKGDVVEPTVRRSIPCENCPRYLNVEVPRGWLHDG